MMVKNWAVEIAISEHDDRRRTIAEAKLVTDRATDIRGTGVAWRNPHDVEVPEIGDELAAARALADLASRLRETAAADIEQMTDRPVQLAR